MIKLALFDVDEKEQAVLSKAFAGENAFELSFYQKPLDVHTTTMAKDAEGIGIFIQSQITQEVLDLLPKVKIIATMTTGFDHIDLEACKARNITVCNIPAYGDNTVAEYAFGLILEEVLQQADVISLHVPYLPSTHHLINTEKLQLVKPTALLVNTARGKVVDTETVAAALRAGRLAGVALDTCEGEEVWMEEEFLKRDDLAAIPLREALDSFSIMRSERAILSHHNTYNTKEALERILIKREE